MLWRKRDHLLWFFARFAQRLFFGHAQGTPIKHWSSSDFAYWSLRSDTRSLAAQGGLLAPDRCLLWNWCGADRRNFWFGRAQRVVLVVELAIASKLRFNRTCLYRRVPVGLLIFDISCCPSTFGLSFFRELIFRLVLHCAWTLHFHNLGFGWPFAVKHRGEQWCLLLTGWNVSFSWTRSRGLRLCRESSRFEELLTARLVRRFWLFSLISTALLPQVIALDICREKLLLWSSDGRTRLRWGRKGSFPILTSFCIAFVPYYTFVNLLWSVLRNEIRHEAWLVWLWRWLLAPAVIKWGKVGFQLRSLRRWPTTHHSHRFILLRVSRTRRSSYNVVRGLCLRNVLSHYWLKVSHVMFLLGQRIENCCPRWECSLSRLLGGRTLHPLATLGGGILFNSVHV